MRGAPEVTSSRATWVDWLEIESLATGGWAGQAQIARVLGIGAEEVREELVEDGVILDGEITDTQLNRILDIVAEEIAHRQKALGSDYPFEVRSAPISLRCKLTAEDNEVSWATYVFSLLISGVATGLVTAGALGRASVEDGRRLFHVCASLGVAGLIGEPRTFWFGFPRPDKTGFAAAVEALSKAFEFSKARVPPPPGLPQQPKDDQVDIVGWRRYGEGKVGTFVVICQAATGGNWNEKSVVSHVENFTQWFETIPYGKAWPTLAFPFVAHQELEEQGDGDFQEAEHNHLIRINRAHGTLLDRLRIVQGARTVSSLDPVRAAETIAGWDMIEGLKDWNRAAVAGLANA